MKVTRRGLRRGPGGGGLPRCQVRERRECFEKGDSGNRVHPKVFRRQSRRPRVAGKEMVDGVPPVLALWAEGRLGAAHHESVVEEVVAIASAELG